MVLVIVADEHRVDAVEWWLAGKQGALERFRQEPVGSKVVPEQWIEYDFGLAVRDQDPGVREVVGLCGREGSRFSRRIALYAAVDDSL